MSVTVKFFSSLRETIGMSESILDTDNLLTVAEVWSKSTNNADLPPNTLVAINMDYVNIDANVKDGDEIAFFPPISGG
ncbi:MAG: MoaD/ThiS family protein [Thiohalomonadales bacterium]